MLAATPDAVVKVVVVANQPQPFIGVVPVHFGAVVSLGQREAPVLDADVLAAAVVVGSIVRQDWDGRAVEFFLAQFGFGQR